MCFGLPLFPFNACCCSLTLNFAGAHSGYCIPLVATACLVDGQNELLAPLAVAGTKGRGASRAVLDRRVQIAKDGCVASSIPKHPKHFTCSKWYNHVNACLSSELWCQSVIPIILVPIGSNILHDPKSWGSVPQDRDSKASP